MAFAYDCYLGFCVFCFLFIKSSVVELQSVNYARPDNLVADWCTGQF